MLAMLWLDRRGRGLVDSWIFMGDEVVYKYGVRVTVEVLDQDEQEQTWLLSNVSVSGD
jgi:hypothetical protein